VTDPATEAAEVEADDAPDPEAEPATGSANDVATETEVRGWGWHVLQLSSWLLLVLLPIHVLSTWVFHDPGHFGVALYVDRWHEGAWRFFDGALVVLALLHGGIGLNGVLGGPGRSPGVRRSVAVAIAVLLGVIGLLAVSTIVSFNVS
jgi:succinate dehydrogenase / fumarate reductase, membrane anchor subunit